MDVESKLQDLPREMLDMILMKAVVKIVRSKWEHTGYQLHTDMYDHLATVWSEWHVRLTTRWFNIVLQRKLNQMSPLLKYMEKPELIKSVDMSCSVWGIALLNRKVYVASLHTETIFVYESVTFKPLKNIECPVSPRDIVGCQLKNCLFAVCPELGSSGTVFCLDPDGAVITKWDLPYEPHNLSVTSCGALLVMCANPRILKYSSDGTLLQDLDLNGTDLVMSWQAISLQSDNYLVCQGWWSQLHQVVELDGNGRLTQSFGNEEGSSNDHLKNPVYMALDKDGCIFVADSGNNRVVLLSKGLVFLKEFLTNADNIVEPYRVLLDETAGLLYIGTNDCRLWVYKVLK